MTGELNAINDTECIQTGIPVAEIENGNDW